MQKNDIRKMSVKNNEIRQETQYYIEEIESDFLSDILADIEKESAIKIPISELASLGAGVASLLPCFRMVTETMTIDGTGLYRVANMAAGDALRAAKDGTYYGSIKAASGSVKFAKFVQAGPITATTKAVTAINPATIMMAASLMSIEKELKDIKELQKKMMSFLEHDKEAQVENDIDALGRILEDYKHNFDNETFVKMNYKSVQDIGKEASRNIRFYQKQIRDITSERKIYSDVSKVQAISKSLQKKFHYYQLSLYTFAFSTFMEIVLLENFKEDFILGKKEELLKLSEDYRIVYLECNKYLEKLGGKLIIPKAFYAVGKLDKTVGNTLRKMPLIEKTNIDKAFRKSGNVLQEEGQSIKTGAIGQFVHYKNPGIDIFVKKIEDMNRIYNRTREICFDKEQIYLIS